MHRPRRRARGRVLLCSALCLLTLLLAACAGPLSALGQASATETPVPDATIDPHALPVGCPHPYQPAIQSGASMQLTPQSGPIGTMVAVDVSGLQPNCHLLLAIVLAPPLIDTEGTPIPAPQFANEAIQWIAVSGDGTVHTAFCVCKTIPGYPIGYPPYPSITPIAGQPNVGAYVPHSGDYFFITVAGANIGNPPPLYAKFSVTT